MYRRMKGLELMQDDESLLVEQGKLCCAVARAAAGLTLARSGLPMYDVYRSSKLFLDGMTVPMFRLPSPRNHLDRREVCWKIQFMHL